MRAVACSIASLGAVVLLGAAARADEAVPTPLRLRPGFRASWGVDVASLPAPAPGVEIAGVLLFGANRVELLGSAWLRERAAADARPGAGASLSLLAAGARYCRAFIQSSFELAGCAGLEAGALLGTSFGVAAPVSGARPWVAPRLGVLGLGNVSPSFSFTLALDVLAPVMRQAFTLAGLGELHRPAPFGARALLGLEAHFR